MKRILVFGSNGMLGTYFCNMLEEKGYEVIRNDYSTGGIDITKGDEVNSLISEVNPQYVVNCAAYTNVDKAEEEPDVAYKVNGDAPGYMASICNELDIPLIHVSTDYVFGDNREKGYPVDYDHFEPMNVYGKSKLEGEKNILAVEGNSYIFRTSWLFGPNATNFISKISEYAKKLPELKVVTDEIGCPTYVRDLSEGMIFAIEERIRPGIYHVCSYPCSRYEFALKIREVMGFDTPIRETTLKELGSKTPRPAISILIPSTEDPFPPPRRSRRMIEDYKRESGL